MKRTDQKGAAVVMALFIVVLCTLAVSPLIWTLFATAKGISVGHVRNQIQQVSLSSIDWARIILRRDKRSTATDHLNEQWAVPLAKTKLSESLMRQEESASDIEDREAILEGQIEDAQSRLNLRNLIKGNESHEKWRIAFDRLCQILGVEAAQQEAVLAALDKAYPDPDKLEEMELALESLEEFKPPILQPLHWKELYNQFDITEETWNQLEPYVVFLPDETKVNVNTAGAEILYAVIQDSSYGDAQTVVTYRETVTFNELNNMAPALNGIQPDPELVDVKSDFFIVHGNTTLENAEMTTSALLKRADQAVFVVWREN